MYAKTGSSPAAALAGLALPVAMDVFNVEETLLCDAGRFGALRRAGAVLGFLGVGMVRGAECRERGRQCRVSTECRDESAEGVG